MHEGQIIGGYRIDIMIGEGAAGWVYQAAATDRPDVPVAVKILKPDALAVPQIVASFQFESRVLLRLEHRNIMKAYEAGNDGEIVFLVTELVAGQPLNAVLGRARRFSPGRTARIGRDLAHGVGHLHDKGYVHRDLKPANVMVADEDLVKIMDLGTVVGVGKTVSYEHGVFGTPSFLAPEQARQAPSLDGRADIYSLGVMLYLMVTGERPFSGERDEVIAAHVEKPAPRASASVDLPPELDDVIDRCLSKSPDDRFADAGQVAAALEPVAALPEPKRGLRRLLGR